MARRVLLGAIAGAGLLQPNVAPENLTDIDLRQGLIADLGGRRFPSIALGNFRDQRIAAIGRENAPLARDHESAVADDAGTCGDGGEGR